jgi:hypothetical protein
MLDATKHDGSSQGSGQPEFSVSGNGKRSDTKPVEKRSRLPPLLRE